METVCKCVDEGQFNMPVAHFEFLVEERSMEAFLRACLPGILPKSCTYEIYAHQGKDALLRKLENRLKAYSNWLLPECRIVVIVDRDNDDCQELKSTLERICKNAGLRSRRTAGGPDWQVVTRLAIEELEAWYFGDWQAVCSAFPRASPNTPRQAKYRNPDAIENGTWEAFERVLKQRGYFRQGLAKVEAATAVGQQIDPSRNQSQSFNVFHNAIVEPFA